MSELNSCPICGCSVRVWAKRFDEEDMEYIIECDNDFCGLTYGISCGYNRDEIEKAWNSITALSPKVNEDCISRADLIESFLADNECKREEAKACMCSLDLTLELIENAPSVTPTEQNEEDILKFYYVESLDEYWIGQRCGTRYYGKWTGNCFTYGYSRYLPWGEHVVAPDTLWKEHTYPSEPKEIPFNEWLQGFLEKECQTERTGEWEHYIDRNGIPWERCSECGDSTLSIDRENINFCPNCGAKMGGDDNE